MTAPRTASNTTAHPAQVNPDAKLIRACYRFAKNELEKWYRDVVAPKDEDVPDWTDWRTYRRIVATPATTPEGWHAKALAYSALDQESYDDHECGRTRSRTFLTSLLRDMVAPARNAIIAGFAAKYGPLPSRYTAEGIWLGYTEEERAAIDAERNAKIAEREKTAVKIYMPRNIATMDREQLDSLAKCLKEWRDIADIQYNQTMERLAGDVA